MEQRISEWRRSMRKGLGDGAVEELEEHLRESIARFLEAGHSPEKAFQTAVKQLGLPQEISGEFDKSRGESWWALKAAWILTCIGTVGLFALFLSIGFKATSLNWLLASHVFAVTGGYLGVYLIGALGICFVCERCIHEFSPARQDYLARASVTFAALATAATAIGIGLAMIWAKLSWGRFWGWDPREVGALGIQVWLLLFVGAGSARIVPARALMLLAIVGNIVVTLGWFGNAAALHSYGAISYAMIACVTVSHLLFIAIGLGPAGWIRSRKDA